MARGYSLHIGVNRYDQNRYYQRDMFLPALPNCDYDAAAKQDIGKRYGYTTAILVDEMATRINVLAGIDFIASRLTEDDIFLLTFSGHGSRVQDRNGDEDDGFDETWCLYDDMILDDELFQRLERFRPGVRVVVIADSCHSGTSIKNATTRFRPGGKFPIVKTNKILAACLLLAACQDRESALSGSQLHNSVYTHHLFSVLDKNKQIRDYRELHEKICMEMPESSQPNLFHFGPGSEKLVKMRPFKI